MRLAGIDSSGDLEYVAVVVCKIDYLKRAFSFLNISEGFHMRREKRAEKRRIARAFIDWISKEHDVKALCIKVNVARIADECASRFRTPRKRVLARLEKFCRERLLSILGRAEVSEIHYDEEIESFVRGFSGCRRLNGPGTALADILAWINLRKSDLNVDEGSAGIVFMDLEAEIRNKIGI